MAVQGGIVIASDPEGREGVLKGGDLVLWNLKSAVSSLGGKQEGGN